MCQAQLIKKIHFLVSIDKSPSSQNTYYHNHFEDNAQKQTKLLRVSSEQYTNAYYHITFFILWLTQYLQSSSSAFRRLLKVNSEQYTNAYYKKFPPLGKQ